MPRVQPEQSEVAGTTSTIKDAKIESLSLDPHGQSGFVDAALEEVSIEDQVSTLVADLFRARYDGVVVNGPWNVDVVGNRGAVTFAGFEVYVCGIRNPETPQPERVVVEAFVNRLRRLLSSDL